MTTSVPHYVDPDPTGLVPKDAKARPGKPKAALREAPKTDPPSSDDDLYRYWRFADLKARGIISSRTDLFDKQRRLGFPKPIHFSEGRMPAARFRVAEVKAWLRGREAAQAAAVAVADASRPKRGRPRKHPLPGAESMAAE